MTTGDCCLACCFCLYECALLLVAGDASVIASAPDALVTSQYRNESEEKRTEQLCSHCHHQATNNHHYPYTNKNQQMLMTHTKRINKIKQEQERNKSIVWNRI